MTFVQNPALLILPSSCLGKCPNNLSKCLLPPSLSPLSIAKSCVCSYSNYIFPATRNVVFQFIGWLERFLFFECNSFPVCVSVYLVLKHLLTYHIHASSSTAARLNICSILESQKSRSIVDCCYLQFGIFYQRILCHSELSIKNNFI